MTVIKECEFFDIVQYFANINKYFYKENIYEAI